MNIPKEIQEMLDYLKEFDADRDRMAQAISEANDWNLIVPDDIRQSYLTGPAH